MLLLALALALAGTTGVALVSLARPRSLVATVVGAVIAAAAELVAVSFALSAFDRFERWWLLGALGVVAAAALALARGRGGLVIRVGVAADALRPPPIAVLAAVVVCELAYVVALAFFTPQNDPDALEYHLTRASFWNQDGAIGIVDGAGDVRMNAFPPTAEILVAVTMAVSHSARYVGLVQLVAALVAALAVAGAARRIGLSRPAAAFGGLVFLALPIVALQASTALNDVVVAALVASAAYFLLGTTRGDAALAAVAVALLVGTKVTGLIALVGLVLVAVVAHRRGPALRRSLAAIGVGALAGGYWYAVNLWRTGDVLGGFPEDQRGGLDPVEWLGRFDRLLLDALELPGAVGRDRLLYAIAAGLVLAVGLAMARSRGGRRAATVAAALTLLPFLVLPVRDGLLRIHQKAWFELGRPDLGNLDPGRAGTKAGTLFTWYGPVGALLALAVGIVVVRRVRRGALPPVAVMLVLAPLIWIGGVAVAVTYFEWNGRFVMGGFALAAATWGLALEARAAAWAVVAVSAVTVGLTLVHYDEKPSGLRLLETTGAQSVWGAPRARVQGILPSLEILIRRTDETIPDGSRIAVWPSPIPEVGETTMQLPPFPLAGPHLRRSLVYATDVTAAEHEGAQWAVLPSTPRVPCVDGWRRAFQAPPWWVVLERVPGATCSR